MIGYIRRKLRALRRRVKYTRDYRLRFEFCRPKIGFGLYQFGDDGGPGHYSLFVFFVWVRLWAATRELSDPDKMLDSWSVSIHPLGERHAYVHWGAWYRFYYFPWSFDWVDTAIRNAAGVFVICDRVRRDGKHEYCYPELGNFHIPDQPPECGFEFTYTTNRGEVQQTTAVVRKVERRRWRWKLCKWLRLPIYRTRYSLDVWFAEELGNERGSWKGGVIGTGCDFVPGESVEAALRRFERRANEEKTFCR